MAKGETVLDLPADERPRERLLRKGPASVSAQELLLDHVIISKTVLFSFRGNGVVC